MEAMVTPEYVQSVQRTDIIQEVLDMNRIESAHFLDPRQKAIRTVRRNKRHIMRIIKRCGDGRVGVRKAVDLLLGEAHEICNIGGIANLGWPAFNSRFVQRVEYAYRGASWQEYANGNGNGKGVSPGPLQEEDFKGIPVLLLSCYHYAEGDKWRGCMGHNFNTYDAMMSEFLFCYQVNKIFGKTTYGPWRLVNTVVIGFDTDSQALRLHGPDPSMPVLFMKDLVYKLEEDAKDILWSFLCMHYPSMHPIVIEDLVSLMLKNIEHVKKVLELGEPPEGLEHKEYVLFAGNAVEWIQRVNYGIICNLDDHRYIKKGILRIQKNMEEGFIPHDKWGLCLNIGYDVGRKIYDNRENAIERVQFHAHEVVEAVLESFPDMVEPMQLLVGITNYADWRLTRVA